jgi:hypothetical protein
VSCVAQATRQRIQRDVARWEAEALHRRHMRERPKGGGEEAEDKRKKAEEAARCAAGRGKSMHWRLLGRLARACMRRRWAGDVCACGVSGLGGSPGTERCLRRLSSRLGLPSQAVCGAGARAGAVQRAAGAAGHGPPPPALLVGGGRGSACLSVQPVSCVCPFDRHTRALDKVRPAPLPAPAAGPPNHPPTTRWNLAGLRSVVLVEYPDSGPWALVTQPEQLRALLGSLDTRVGAGGAAQADEMWQE